MGYDAANDSLVSLALVQPRQAELMVFITAMNFENYQYGPVISADSPG
jgi:hypothetical protein